MNILRIVYFLYTDFLAAAVVIVIQFSFLCGVLVYASNHVNPVTSVVAMCKIYMYVQQTTAMIQRWLMAAASFDRYACSSSRAGLRRFATVRVARRIVLAIVAIWFVIPVYRLVFYDIRPNDCDIFGNYMVALIHSIYTAIAGGVVPLLIMVPSVIFIQRNLARKRQRRRQIGVQQKEGKNEAQEVDRKRDQQVLAILLVQLIAYIILITPLEIVQIYDAVTLSISNKSIDRLIIEQFVFNIADTLASIYSAMPFYLSTIMSRMFRDELAIVVRKVFHCRWLTNARRVEPLAINIKAKALPAIS
jgi:hypothetical protein